MPQDGPYSGFNALPVELQGLIFEQYLPEFADVTPTRKVQVDNPVTLSLVCRDWRYIVLTTPGLWSGMSIVVHEHASASQSQKLCRQLERWLALSKSHPLFIRLSYAYSGRKTFSAYGGSSADALGLRVVSMLRVHVGRWRNVVFLCPSTFLKPLVDGDAGSCSSESPVLHGIKDAYDTTMYPQLRGFTLDVTNTPSTARAVDFRDLRLPLEALTQLHLVADHNRLLSLGECRDLLARCPQLRRCTLNAGLCEDGTAGRSSQSMKQHSQPAGESMKPTCDLEQLCIQLRPSTSTHADPTRVPQALANFLNELHLDSLTELTVEWMGNLAPSCGGASQLAQTLAQCGSLESFDLRYIPLTTDEMLTCLRGLGGLRSLALTYSMDADSARFTSPVNKQLLLALEDGARGDLAQLPRLPLLPRLRTLRLVSHCSDVDDADVMHFLDRRCVGVSGVQQLRSFKLLWARRVSSDLQTRLTDMWCAVRGLEVDVDRFRYGRD